MRVVFSAMLCVMLACTTEKSEMSIDDEIDRVCIETSSCYDSLIYYPDSSLKAELKFSEEKQHGVQRYFYPNQKLHSERTYLKGVKVGIHKGYWSDGSIRFKYSFDQDGRYDGEVLEYYESGQLYKHFNYVHGKEEGAQKMWKSDGRLKANYVVKDGEKFGLIGVKRCRSIHNDTLVP